MSNFVSNLVMSLDEQIVELRMIVELAGGAEAEHALAKAIAKRNGSPEMQAYRASVTAREEYAETMAVGYTDGPEYAKFDPVEMKEWGYLENVCSELYGTLTPDEQDSLGVPL